jgi:hypothetical protein
VRKYMIVVLIFILSACSLGQKHTSQPASAPTNAPTEASAFSTTQSSGKRAGKSAPTNVPAPTSAPILAGRSGSPAIQTVGLNSLDNGQIVYDANQHVYWLANADLAADPAIRATMGVTGINPNGTMNYTTALQWVNALNHTNNGSGYLGHTNWQLPANPPVDETCAVLHGNDGNSFGPRCTGSALGNLYSVGLANTYPNSVIPGFTDTIGLIQNLQPSLYWTSQPDGSGQKTFSFNTDLIGTNTTVYNYFYVLPMVTGKIGVTTGGLGLVSYSSGPAAGKAVYDTATNVTWVLDASLAASQAFGITGTTKITTSNGVPVTVMLINPSGAMLFATANSWLKAANNFGYAGINNWKLPAPGDLQTLFNDLNLQPGDTRLMAQGSVGPFLNLQPYFYWACQRDQTGTSQSPCNGNFPGNGPDGKTRMEWSFISDTGFQATDQDTKEFYVEVYYQ